MQSISESLSAAVRAAIVLTPGERVAFVGQHLRAQHAGLPLPQPSAISRRATRETLQAELRALAETLTTAVNAAASLPGTALENVASHLLEQSAESVPATGDGPAPTAAPSRERDASADIAAGCTTR